MSEYLIVKARQNMQGSVLLLGVDHIPRRAPGTCLDAGPRLVHSLMQLWSLEDHCRNAGLVPECEPHFQFNGSCCFMSCWPYSQTWVCLLSFYSWRNEEGITFKLVQSFNWQSASREMWNKQLRKHTLSIALKKVYDIINSAVWHQHHGQ